MSLDCGASAACKDILKTINEIEVELGQNLIESEVTVDVINRIKAACHSIIEVDDLGWY